MAVVLLLALLQANPPSIPNWKFERTVRNPKTGKLEVVAILRGREAVPIDIQKGIFEVRGLKANVFTDPKKPGEKSQELEVTSGQARLDKPKGELVATDHVRVVRKSDGLTLDTERAQVDLDKRTLKVPGAFRAVQPTSKSVLTGNGLAADDALRMMVVERDGELRMAGPPPGVGKAPPDRPGSSGVVTHVRSPGRLTVQEISPTQARVTGVPQIDADQGPNRIRAQALHIDRAAGLLTFRGKVSSEMAVEDSAPRTLTADTLVAHTDLETGEIRSFEAINDVRLGNLMNAGGGPPGEAKADRFSWDIARESGLLEGSPTVTIHQGPNLIAAPRLVLAGRSTMILKGPKRVRLQGERDGKVTTLSATAGGDIVMDRASGWIVMEHRCRLTTDDFRLEADRLRVRLAGDGRSVASVRASGNIRAFRLQDGMILHGDRMSYDPADGAVSITGFPYAVLDQGGQISWARVFRFNENEGAMSAEGGVHFLIRETGR